MNDHTTIYPTPEAALEHSERWPFYGYFVEIARTTPHSIVFGERVALAKQAPGRRGWYEVTSTELRRYVEARRRRAARRTT